MPVSSAHAEFADIWLRNQEFAPDPHVERLHLRRGFCLEHHLSTEEERRTLAYYQETARAGDRQWWAASNFLVDNGKCGFPVYRRRQQGPFTMQEGHYLAAVGLRLASVVRVAKRFGAVNVTSGLAALERLDCAALVVDERGIATTLNGPAQRLLCDDLRLIAGRLWVRDRGGNSRLRGLVRFALTAAKRGVAPACEPVIISRCDLPWLLVDAMPVTEQGGNLFGEGRIILILTDLTSRSAPDEMRLRVALSFTAAEARLTKMLVSGHDIDTAAALLRVSRETVRTQLKAVFAKTNTRRQAELVALIARVRTPRLS